MILLLFLFFVALAVVCLLVSVCGGALLAVIGTFFSCASKTQDAFANGRILSGLLYLGFTGLFLYLAGTGLYLAGSFFWTVLR